MARQNAIQVCATRNQTLYACGVHRRGIVFNLHAVGIAQHGEVVFLAICTIHTQNVRVNAGKHLEVLRRSPKTIHAPRVDVERHTHAVRVRCGIKARKAIENLSWRSFHRKHAGKDSCKAMFRRNGQVPLNLLHRPKIGKDRYAQRCHVPSPSLIEKGRPVRSAPT